jgi:hypothetical protein
MHIAEPLFFTVMKSGYSDGSGAPAEKEEEMGDALEPLQARALE